ncbi:MAG TPA: hypothetical protein VGN23_14830 [Verrucomicrobiae bacterium]|jgi:hypothetical protein
MKSGELVEDIDTAFEIIRPNGKPHRVDEKMTAEDWNKFERDIVDAFEKVPRTTNL